MRILYFLAAFVLFGTPAAFLARSFFAPSNSGDIQSWDPSVFQSGPQVGSKIPGPFHPLNINGRNAGEEECLFCQYGYSPVVMVFASKPTEGLTELIRKIEKGAVDAGKAHEVGACVVVTNTSAETKSALTKLVDNENLKQVILGIIEPQHLKKYQLNPEAEVTVLLYSKQVVRVNHVYKTEELTEKVAIEVGNEASKFLAEN